MSKNEKQICEDICEILRAKLNVPERLLIEENYCVPLTGALFQLDDINMTYLYLEIIATFKIQIKCSEMINYGFISILNMAQVISNIERRN